MALIGKIRQNFWLVLIVLGLALASFVIMDIMGSRNAGGMFNQTTVGEVGDEKIDYTEFSKVENALFSGNSDIYARRNSVWNYLVEKSLVNKTVAALGLGVSQEELMDLQFGTNLSPVIQNNFRDQQTGAVDRQQLLQIKQAIENNQELNQQFRDYWAHQEVQIIKTANQEKINNLVSKAVYTPSWMAELTNNFNTETATFEYVKVPFDKVADADITLTDADYQAYLDLNQAKYFKSEETRLIDYVVFDVFPTKEDSMLIKTKVESLMEGFRTTKNDSTFAANNNGGYSFVYSKPDDMSGVIKDNIQSLGSGDLYGPYVENGYYQVAKVVDKRVIADSVKARHILRSVTNNDPTQRAAANATIDSIMNVMATRGGQFDSLAIKFSQDPGSGFKGGDLGTFGQGAMVGPFNNACFVDSKEGGLYKVSTQFGVHLIQVQKIIYNDRDPKYKMAVIGSAIVPSEATQNILNDKASELMRTNRTIESLRKAVEASSDFTLKTSKPLMKNDFVFGDLGSGEESRAIVKWAYEAAPGEVSPAIYTYTDKVNYFNSNYVVAGVKSIQKPGKMSIEEAKASISDVVKNYKKGESISSKITGTDLSSIAAQFGTVVDTARNVSFNGGFIPNSGAEPKVVAKLFKGNQGDIVGPVTGNTGVYIAKMLSKTPSLAATNIPQVKKSVNSTSRSQVSFRLWEAVKKKANPSDNRSKFF